jgi:uncharacterized membrane protein YhhN
VDAAFVSELACALATASLVVAEKVDSPALRWASKPAASTAFVALGISVGALATPYGRFVMAALVLGWFGDLLLLGRGKGPFVLGLGSFLVGHAVFGAGFVVRGVAWPVVACTAVLLAVPVWALARWLRPSVPGSLRAPVMAYLGVIAVMVALAAGTSWARPGWAIVVAALMFAVSDVSVARARFKDAAWTNKAWGLPLYYAAQCVLAVSAGSGR